MAALAALAGVAARLARRGYRWGPGGSVGFELGTRVATATASSDREVTDCQARRLEPHEAPALRAALTERQPRRRSTCCSRRRVAVCHPPIWRRGRRTFSCARQMVLVF